MSRSFVDELAKTPPPPRRRVQVMGFDPDVSIMGWAVIEADIGGGIATTYTGVELGKVSYEDLVHKKSKAGKQQAYDVVRGLCMFKPLLDRLGGWMVVESQDFYPKPDEKRGAMVAKANSLIMVAHVSGGVHALALSRGMPVLVVQPSQWKGQRDKPADHARSLRILGTTPMYLMGSGPATHPLPRAWEHALDGLGMALYGIEQLHRGLWNP